MAVEIDPLVQQIYDGLNAKSKSWLHERMIKAGLTLADLKTKPPKKPGLAPSLDLRILNSANLGTKKKFVRTRRDKSKRQADAGNATMGEAVREGKGTTAGPDIPRGEKLPKDKDLGKYIADQLGDGKELADFYLGILRSAGTDGLKKGVWLTHRLQAAQWLGDRGWGKAKGDEEGKGAIQINIMDYSQAEVSPPKVVNITTSKTEPDFKGPAKIEAPIEEINGKAEETKTSSPVLVEQINERFELEEIEVE